MLSVFFLCYLKIKVCASTVDTGGELLDHIQEVANELKNTTRISSVFARLVSMSVEANLSTSCRKVKIWSSFVCFLLIHNQLNSEGVMMVVVVITAVTF
jgi:hypothetical protein